MNLMPCHAYTSYLGYGEIRLKYAFRDDEPIYTGRSLMNRAGTPPAKVLGA